MAPSLSRDYRHQSNAMSYYWEQFDKMFITLWAGDEIWRRKSGSELIQVMACCFTAPMHCLNQSWLIICNVQWRGNFYRRYVSHQSLKLARRLLILKFYSYLPEANELIILPGPKLRPPWGMIISRAVLEWNHLNLSNKSNNTNHDNYKNNKSGENTCINDNRIYVIMITMAVIIASLECH